MGDVEDGGAAEGGMLGGVASEDMDKARKNTIEVSGNLRYGLKVLRIMEQLHNEQLAARKQLRRAILKEAGFQLTRIDMNWLVS